MKSLNKIQKEIAKWPQWKRDAAHDITCPREQDSDRKWYCRCKNLKKYQELSAARYEQEKRDRNSYSFWPGGWD